MAKQGYVAILPNYQLYRDVKFPVFVNDVGVWQPNITMVFEHNEIVNDFSPVGWAAPPVTQEIASLLRHVAKRLAQAALIWLSTQVNIR